MVHLRRQTGFSLLEAIVTLVIFSLLVTVLMQALQHALQVRERVFRHQQVARIYALQSRWFRDSIAASITTAAGEGLIMEGDERGVRFYTQSALEDRGYGQIRWRLQAARGGDELRYISDDRNREILVMPGPLAATRFAYLDETGSWQREWKPKTGDAIRLPRAIMLEGEGPSGAFTWIAGIRGNRKPATLKLPPEVFL